jgi:superfamily I DNA/RNA helicase
MEKVLSKYQVAIINEPKKLIDKGENIVVEALAGGAKTFTIIEAMKFARGKVLGLAFNKIIKEEFQRRAPRNVDIKTCHGFGNSVVQALWGKQIVDNDRVKNLIREYIKPEPQYEDVCLLQNIISKAKNFFLSDEEEIRKMIVENDMESPKYGAITLASMAIDILGRCVECTGFIDFDDMVWLPCCHQMNIPKYNWVFVDETQDLNYPQLWMVQQAGREGRVMAVGDRRQSIYQFRGADKEAIPRMIRELNARVLPLSISYRCARSIVRVAQEIVPEFEAAPNAPEGQVLHCFKSQMKPRIGDFILSRTNAPLMPIALGLLRDGIRAKIQGRDIGQTLAKLIERSHCDEIVGLVEWLSSYQEKELRKLIKAHASEGAIEALRDKVDTIKELCEGIDKVSDLLRRINGLFADDGQAQVILSTTHRAKGLEADTVWVLESTYRPDKGEEEANLWYVAVTRAKNTLWIVQG